MERLRERLRKWFESRISRRDSVTLTQRTVYILPTPAGWMLTLTLLVLLIASINFQLNLGYALTFLLAGCAVVGMYVCHETLRGLSMHLIPPHAHFANTSIPVSIQLTNHRKSNRYSIALALWGTGHWSWTNVPSQSHSTVQVACSPMPRGLHYLPSITAETRYPLGTFRVWTVWRPAARVLVYPAPEAHAPALPPGIPDQGGALASHHQPSDEFEGVRAYRQGDPLKRVVWKKAAKAGELVSRDAMQVHRMEIWLDMAHTATLPSLEQRLSRLCAWVLAAQALNVRFGLRLPTVEIPPNAGDSHAKACLEALALYSGT